MNKRYFIALLGIFIVFYLGCQRGIIGPRITTHAQKADQLIACGNMFDTTLINFNGELSGSITVMNDTTGFHVVIKEVYTDYKITRVQLLYGTEQHVIDNIVGLIDCATMQPRNPDTVVNYSPDQDSVVVIDLPFKSLSCFFMNANITLAKRDAAGNLLHSFNIWSNGTSNPSQNPCQQYFKFCRQQCTITPPSGNDSSCGQLRTQTQHGWGSSQHNSNSRAYLRAHFAAAFPSGLTVGCSNGHTILLTSAKAVGDLLPSEGKTEALKSNYTNPVNLKNSLVGEIVALNLNVGFDKYDPAFGAAGKHLEDMFIKKGKFGGMTVKEFLDLANKALGNCGNSSYKLSDIRNMAKHINDNYKNGDEDKHRLVCSKNDCSHDDHDEDDDDDDHDDHDDHDGHDHHE